MVLLYEDPRGNKMSKCSACGKSIKEAQDPELVSTRTYDDFLFKQFNRNNRVLIIGCGAGVQSALFPNAVNIDIELGCLQFCKNKGIQNLILADAKYLPIKANKFNGIIMADIIEHFPNKPFLRHVVMELRRIIVLHGNVAVIMPLRDPLVAFRKVYNAIMNLPIPVMALLGHTLALGKNELIGCFDGFYPSIVEHEPGQIFGITLPAWMDGGYGFVVFEKR